MTDDDKPQGGHAMLAMLELVQFLFVLALDKQLIGYPELQQAIDEKRREAIAKGQHGGELVYRDLSTCLRRIARDRGLREADPQGRA